MRALSGRAIAVAPEPRSGTVFGAEPGADARAAGHRDLSLQVADETQLRGAQSRPQAGRRIQAACTGRVVNHGE
jgi:hypothetical protein